MFTVVVADNVSVKTITVSGATPFIGNPPIDPPIDGPGDDIIDENKINEDAIQLSQVILHLEQKIHFILLKLINIVTITLELIVIM